MQDGFFNLFCDRGIWASREIAGMLNISERPRPKSQYNRAPKACCGAKIDGIWKKNMEVMEKKILRRNGERHNGRGRKRSLPRGHGRPWKSALIAPGKPAGLKRQSCVLSQPPGKPLPSYLLSCWEPLGYYYSWDETPSPGKTISQRT